MKILRFLITIFLVFLYSKSFAQTNYYKMKNGKILTEEQYSTVKQNALKNGKVEEIILKREIKNDSIIITARITILMRDDKNNYFDPYSEPKKLIGKHFPIENFKNSKQKQFSKNYLKGKPTFINFWFTRCLPCIEEIPMMNNLKEKYDDIKKEIKANEMKIDNMNRLTTSINENKALIKTYQEKYNNIRNDIKNNNELTREFETMKDENNVIKIIRDIVSNDLPSRMLESYLNDISHMVNILLSDFMSIRFDVTDGIDIVCNRDGEERLSQNLSQGESSMLSIALLMTFKKSINWDIISIDEGSSVLDEVNKDRYIAMIRDYSETVNTLKQIFLVSHDYIIDSSADVKIITIGD